MDGAEAPVRLVAGPFNRVEGDLEVHLDVADGRVVEARVNAPLYRGFEKMLVGKDPRDALTITPRICGICSVSQSMAAARALADVQGARAPEQGMIAAAIIHGVENLADHLTHFHLFFMPDFAREAYAGRSWHARMKTRFEAARGEACRAALEARAGLLHVLGSLAGKWPHTLAVQPGGVTKAPGPQDRARIISALRGLRAWAERTLFAGPLEEFAALETDEALTAWASARSGNAALFLEAAEDASLRRLGPGAGRYLSFGGYALPDETVFAPGLWSGDALQASDPRLLAERIAEDGAHAWLLDREPRHPFDGATRPDPAMAEPGYTWCKAPRLDGRPVETGALARQVVDGHPLARALAAPRDGAPGGDARARVVARLLEIARLMPLLESWAEALTPGAPFMAAAPSAREGRGLGLTEAARGALGHWLTVEDGRIAAYQIVAPTTWNFSPRDADGVPGPLEAALVGAPAASDEQTPLAVQHIVRSFDPCMVCTVH